jgi:hypothetical protein
MQEATISGGNLMVRFDDGWVPLMEIVAFVWSQSEDIGVNVMSDGQRSRIKHWHFASQVILLPLYFAMILLNPSQIACNLCCDFCGKGCKAMFRPLKGQPKAQSNNASKRLMEDSKDFFFLIVKLCQPAVSAKGKAEQIAHNIEQTILSWHGLVYRNTSHAPDRFINFGYGCAKSEGEFQFMRDVMSKPSGDRLREWILS